MPNVVAGGEELGTIIDADVVSDGDGVMNCDGNPPDKTAGTHA